MKKKYIEPTLKVSVVRAHTMFASSPSLNSCGTDSAPLSKEEDLDEGFDW